MKVSRDTVPMALVDPDLEQPRQYFDPDALTELATSIRENGLAVPILVRPAGRRYVIVHGERRWRAVQQLGWSEIPAEIRDLDDTAVRWLQLAENLNRDDLSPMEEARAYQSMLDTGQTQQSLAARLGKDRSYVTQKLRLLNLPAPLSVLTDRRALSEGHIRQLLRIKGVYSGHTIAGRIDPEVWGGLGWPAGAGDRADYVFGLVIGCRPEDWPPCYPFKPTHPIVADAGESMCRDIAETGSEYPMWVLPAFYFAALTVTAKVSVANLDRLIDNWIQRIYAALVYTRDIHHNSRPQPVSRDTYRDPRPYLSQLLWWSHRADLRHAGLDQDNEHLSFESAMSALSSGSLALPSQCQPGGPQHDEYLDLAARADDWAGRQ